MERICPQYFAPVELLQRFASKCRVREEQTDIDRAIVVLAAEWRTDPARGVLMARPLKDANPAVFCVAGLRAIQTDQISAFGFLRAILTVDLLIHALLSPSAFGRHDAIELAKELARFDPAIDLHLVSAFLEGNDAETMAVDKRAAQRILELVDSVTDNLRRVMPLLMALQKFEDSWVRSKLASMWVRHVGATPWVGLQLQDPDPRIRANVVEGLWAAPSTSEKRHLLRKAERDQHQRVVGNALVGLVRMRDEGADERLEALAAHQSADFRATAAWAMGELGYASYRPRLLQMIHDEHSKVRQNALKALSRIRKAQELLEEEISEGAR